MTWLKRIKKPLQVAFLAVFIILTAGIHFLHTESTAAGQANCPACHFQALGLSLGPALVFVLPLLVVLGAIVVEAKVRLDETDVGLFFARSPPAA
jgi:lipopolysaccharide export LptBFGC system permease protein LptF